MQYVWVSDLAFPLHFAASGPIHLDSAVFTEHRIKLLRQSRWDFHAAAKETIPGYSGGRNLGNLELRRYFYPLSSKKFIYNDNCVYLYGIAEQF